MIWPWQRYRPTDEIISCTCGSTLPAMPQLPLANMVRRGSSIVRINTGWLFSCLECHQKYFIASQGPHRGVAKAIGAPRREHVPVDEVEALARRMGKRVVPVYTRDEMRDPP